MIVFKRLNLILKKIDPAKHLRSMLLFKLIVHEIYCFEQNFELLLDAFRELVKLYFLITTQKLVLLFLFAEVASDTLEALNHFDQILWVHVLIQ